MLVDAITYTVDRLRAAGLAAVADPRDLNLPGAWVYPGTLLRDTLAGAGEADVQIALVVPDLGGLDTLRALDELLGQAQAAGLGLAEFEPATVTLDNHGAGGLPALIASATIRLDP